MNAKHTPGPWRYDPYWSLIHGPKGVEIAAVHAAQLANEKRARLDTAHANAALLAAAPELLAALSECASLLADMNAAQPWGNSRTVLSKAQDTIAKATGPESEVQP